MSVGYLSSEGEVVQQVAAWWHEAEAAARSNRLPRARRFLRWILACCPEDEEAWLWLARLASSQAARLAYLRQAYAFHPNSGRVQALLRQARSRQLELAVGDLKGDHSLLRCLPNQRHICHANTSCQDKGRSHTRIRRKRGNGRSS
jgi:hypothetical protein